MWTSLIVFPVLAGSIGWVLGLAAIRLRVEKDPVVDKIANLLPNGQCGQCGYPGCAQAAEAMASGEAPPTCCPPGGPSLVAELCQLLGVTVSAGGERAQPKLALIKGKICDGCHRCARHCPFDAIVGANRVMHGVYTDLCTGCGICVDHCPQEAISLYTDPMYTTQPEKPQLRRCQ